MLAMKPAAAYGAEWARAKNYTKLHTRVMQPPLAGPSAAAGRRRPRRVCVRRMVARRRYVDLYSGLYLRTNVIWSRNRKIIIERSSNISEQCCILEPLIWQLSSNYALDTPFLEARTYMPFLCIFVGVRFISTIYLGEVC